MNKALKKKVCIAAVVIVSGTTVVVAGTSGKIASKAATSTLSTTGGVISIADYNSNNKIEKVGYGYNAISGDYSKMEGIIDNNFIFAKRSASSKSSSSSANGNDKFIEDTYVKVDTGYSNGKSYIVNGRNSEEFINSFKSEVSNKTNLGLSGDISPLGLKLYLEVNNKFERQVTEGKVSEYIMSVKEPVVASVSWNLKESKYYEYLDEDFKYNLVNMDPEKLFKKYGTHFFTSYLLGGRLELNSMISSDTNEQLTTLTTAFKSTVKAEGNIDGNNISADTSPSVDVTITDKDTLAAADIKTEAKYYGGKEADFDAYADILAARVLGSDDKNKSTAVSCSKIYQDWITSVEEEPTLIDVYDDNSLYPIWDLLALFPEDNGLASKEELTNRAKLLEETYTKLKKEYDDNIKNQVDKIQTKEKATIISTTLTGYKDNSSYQDSAEIDNYLGSIHKGYKLGDIYVTNAYRNDNDLAVLTNNKFQIVYNMTEDKYNLPTGDVDNAIKHSLIQDLDINYKIKGYGDIFKYKYLQNGGAYVQVRYKNKVTSEPVKLTNVFENINKNQSVVLYTSNPSEVYDNGGIESINVLIMYKTRALFCKYGTTYTKKIKWMDEGKIEFK